MKKKPNILFLFSDQHNARCIGAKGHEELITPNLDRLVHEGVSFDKAYCNNPICTPSRMCFLSSLYASTHGYYALYGKEPRLPMTNMFSYFKSLGYRTGALGKIHTPKFWIEKDCQFLYDEFNEHPKYLEAVGLYEENDNRPFAPYHPTEQASPIPYEHSCESVLAKQTLRFMRNQGEPKDRGEDDAPWFAWVSFSRPHDPHTPSEPFASMYSADTVKMPPVGKNEKPETEKNRQSTVDNLKEHVAAYYALVSQVDHAIGTILEELEKTGELENTIIVYSSDHGEFCGEHGLREKQYGINYNCTTRIPLIFRYPKSFSHGVSKTAVVESVDVFPTLCELIDVDTPNSVQGSSLTEFLKNPEAENFGKFNYALTENALRKAICDGRFRYIANLSDTGEQDGLYDTENDIWEHTNLIDDENYSDVKSRLQRKMIELLSKANKPATMMTSWHDHTYDCDGYADMKNPQETHALYW